MSAPRRLLPGTTYLVTRRCTQRQFLLRPSELTNQIFVYCLAVAAERTGVEIHSFVVMSNHWHAVLTDPEARLPEMLQLHHRMVARCMNLSLGRTENFWASDHASAIALQRPEDVLDKMAYVMVNPTAAGLVESAREWPGAITTELGEVLVVRRPDVYFREDGGMPPTAKLVCTMPRMLRGAQAESHRRRLRVLVEQGIRRARSAIRGSGRTFLGASGARAMPFTRTATTPDPLQARRPTIAAQERAVRKSAVDQLCAFRRLYRSALDRWRSGERETRFPEGTYLMRVLHGASCGGTSPPS